MGDRGPPATSDQIGRSRSDLDYSWDDASRLVGVAYGSATRTFAYDHLGRLTEDVLRDSGGTLAARHAYTHDDDGNVTSQVITLAGNAGSGTHTYAYDRSGRIASWTKPGGSAWSTTNSTRRATG